nr:hypothetical protein CFP56_27874 [Quercus suber]
MARFNHKYHSSSTKSVFLTSCASLLGVALIADFLRTSSYTSAGSAYLSVASNWALKKSGTIAVPNATAKTDDKTQSNPNLSDREQMPTRLMPSPANRLPQRHAEVAEYKGAGLDHTLTTIYSDW